MSLNKKRIIRIVLGLSLVLCTLTLFRTRISAVRAMSSAANPNKEISKPVQYEQATELRRVYVGDVLALPVVQQPVDDSSYVSSNIDEITQFSLASQLGNTGLLAHNYLAGKLFSQIAIGQEVLLEYSDNHVEYFIVSKVLRFQALQPNSAYSSFKNLDTNKTLTAEQLFNSVYGGDRRVTFQTCIAADGNVSWGRLFIIATPKN